MWILKENNEKATKKATGGKKKCLKGQMKGDAVFCHGLWNMHVFNLQCFLLLRSFFRACTAFYQCLCAVIKHFPTKAANCCSIPAANRSDICEYARIHLICLYRPSQTQLEVIYSIYYRVTARQWSKLYPLSRGGNGARQICNKSPLR